MAGDEDRVPKVLYVAAGASQLVMAVLLVWLATTSGLYDGIFFLGPPLILSAALLFHAGGVKGS